MIPPLRWFAGGLFIVLLGIADPLVAQAPPVEGRWDGILETPPAPLEVTLGIFSDRSGWTGTFSLPAEGIADMPVAEVAVQGDRLIVRVTPTRVVEVVVEGDVAHGTLVLHDQGGRTTPVSLYREGSAAWEAFNEAFESTRAEREAALDAARPPALRQAARGPAADRVDSAALARFVDAAGRSHTSALVVMLDGDVVGEWYSGGSSRRIEAMSATKSVLSLAVGRLLELGLLESIDVPVHLFYQEWADGPYAEITVRHLLSHTSGIESPLPTTPIYGSEDFVRFALESPLVAVPGTEFQYNNSATNLLAGLIGRVAGQRMDRFLADELFAPLGIEDFSWSLDASGNPHGMAGLQIHARDLARLGQLVLQGGEWKGQRLVSTHWIERSTRLASPLSETAGFLWWLTHDDDRVTTIRAAGYLGQYLVVIPESGLVGVRLIEGFPGYDQERDGFHDFAAQLMTLVSD